MSCGPVEFVNGGVLNETKILDAEATNLKINQVYLQGGIAADEMTLMQLAALLGPFLDPTCHPHPPGCHPHPPGPPGPPGTPPPPPPPCPEPFKTCAGYPHLPGALIPTKDEMEAAIAAAANPAVILANLANAEGLPLAPGVKVPTKGEMEAAIAAAVDPASILGQLLNCEESPIAPGTKLATKGEMEAAIGAAVDPAGILGQLLDCEGAPVSPGTKVSTCEELACAIDAAASPAVIAGVFKNNEGNALSPGTQLLSKTETESLVVAETTKVVTEQITTVIDQTMAQNNFVKAQVSGSAPAPSPGQDLPDTVIGGRTFLLGTPAAYMPVTVSGTNYLMPLYGV
jgi:hypothetical protein